MRIFVGQTNRIWTDPVVNKSTGDLLNGADVTVRVFDHTNTLVTGSEQILAEDGSTAIYSIVLDVLSIVDKEKCKIELTIEDGGTVVWYFKGPIKAIIRDQFWAPQT